MSPSLSVSAGSELGEVLLGIVGGEESCLQALADEIGLPRTTLRRVIEGHDMTRETEGRIFAYLVERGFEVRGRLVTLDDVRAMHPHRDQPPPVEPEWLRLQVRMFEPSSAR